MTSGSFDPVAYNRAAWDREVERENMRDLSVFADDSFEALDARAEFVVRHQIPFSATDLPEDERRRIYGAGPIEYSHTLTEQIGGQLAAGFTLTHLIEAPHHADATARYLPGYIATRAVKGPRG
jgi:hypothetical protein